MSSFSRLNKVAAAIAICLIFFSLTGLKAQNAKPKFKVIAFYTAQEDKAHIRLSTILPMILPKTGTTLTPNFYRITRWYFF